MSEHTDEEWEQKLKDAQMPDVVSDSSACTGSLRRPPCVLMTASAAMEADCGALKKLCDAGYEVVVVKDDDLADALLIVEIVRKDTANTPVEGERSDSL